MTARTLTAVRTAARRKHAAADAYRRAVAAARADKHTLAQIADAAGTSKQNVHKLLNRTPKEES